MQQQANEKDKCKNLINIKKLNIPFICLELDKAIKSMLLVICLVQEHAV